MIRCSLSILLLSSLVCIGAQSSGIFVEGHISQGKQNGDKLRHFEGNVFGSMDDDSIHYILDGQESSRENTYSIISSYPVDFQYSVQFSFSAGYEKSFTKLLSLRGGVGYQKVVMDAYAARIDLENGSMNDVPFVSAEIRRHWLSIPVDFKVTLPIRRSGLYLTAGPKASILLSSEYADSISTVTQDLADLTPRFNLSLGVRLGAEFPLSRIGYIFVESGYHHGLLNTSLISSARMQEGEISYLGAGFRMNIP